MEIRKPEQLAGLSGLIIPGGESTTMAKLAEKNMLVRAQYPSLSPPSSPFVVQRCGWDPRFSSLEAFVVVVVVVVVAVSSSARICELRETDLGDVRWAYILGRQSFR